MRVLLIVPGEQLRSDLSAELMANPNLQIARSLGAFPDLDDLLRTIRVQRPDFLVLSVEDLPTLEPLLNGLEDLMPGLPVVGVANRIDEELAHRLMHLGIREYLVPPFTREKVGSLLDFLLEQSKKRPHPAAQLGDLYTFFPAKPGVGATTVALAASCALAEELSVRTLLIDGDLAAGIVKFHLHLGNSSSILDAIHQAENLDEDMWRQMVGRHGKLHALHAGDLNPLPQIAPASLQRVLAMARAQYDVICADLGSSLDSFSIELLRESRRIFLITTPEVAPVHLARARIRSLTGLGLADRVSLVLNRKDHWRSHLDTRVVGEAAGLPVAYCIGNDYQACTEAELTGSPIPSHSDLGRSIMDLAQCLAPGSPRKDVPAGRGRKFLEFFHISQVASQTTPMHD